MAIMKLFGEGGYHDVSMDDIAEMAGVTVPTLYLHLADKATLLINSQASGIGWLNVEFAGALGQAESLTMV